MVVRSSFFNSVGGDRIYDAPIFAEYFASFIGNGVFPNPSTSLQVLQATNLQTNVAAGRGWINGYYVNNTSNYILQHDIADGVLDRIDRVVFGLNLSTREITIYIKRGAPSASPVAPALVRNGTLHELALADVRINRGALAITQSNITDTRLNTSLCGYVAGLVQQLDTTTLFNQYQDFYNNLVTTSGQRIDTLISDGDQRFRTWETNARDEFEVWYASVRGLLDGDVATNLSNRITEVDGKIGNIATLTTNNKSNIVNAINEHQTAIQNIVNDPNKELANVRSGTSTTPSTTAIKTVSIPGYVDSINAKVLITFTQISGTNGTSLSINGLPALPILFNGISLSYNAFRNGTSLLLQRVENGFVVVTPNSQMLNTLPLNGYTVNTSPTGFLDGSFNIILTTNSIVNGFSESTGAVIDPGLTKIDMEIFKFTSGTAGSSNVTQRITFIGRNSVSGNTTDGKIFGVYQRNSVTINNSLSGWNSWVRLDTNNIVYNDTRYNTSLGINASGDGLTFTYEEA